MWGDRKQKSLRMLELKLIRNEGQAMLKTIDIQTSITEISQILQDDPDPKNRSLAAKKLGEIGNEIAVPSLCHAINNDPDAEVRGSAIRALGKLGRETSSQED